MTDFRQTKPRLAILEVLTDHEAPLEVLKIKSLAAQKKVTMDKVTVYRILEAFTKLNLVNRVELQEGKFRYELARGHHHHLICDNCGAITDVKEYLPANTESDILKQQKFLVKRHAVEFFGLCKNCH